MITSLLSVALSAPPCLPAPDPEDLVADTGLLVSAGLDADQIDDAFLLARGALDACLPPGLSGQLLLAFTVACSGEVEALRVLEQRELPAPVVSCLTRELSVLRFPPHAQPEGTSFDYRLYVRP